MQVTISDTITVTDEQRVQIKCLKNGTKGTAKATEAEVRKFVRDYGLTDWAGELMYHYADKFGKEVGVSTVDPKNPHHTKPVVYY